MSKHLGKRERRAGKIHKRIIRLAWQRAGVSGSLTLKLGTRKWKKIDYNKLTGFPF
jgi:hypothetical protein